MNVLRTLIGFVAFMILFIGGAFIGGPYLAIAGFIAGIGALAAIGMGKVSFKTRELRDIPPSF